MMLDEAKIARERLTRADEASSSVEEAEALARKKKDLRDLVDKVEILATRRSMLLHGGVPLSQPPDVGKPKELCARILTRFSEAPKVKTLVDNQRWTKLAQVLTEFSASEDMLQKQDWKVFFNGKLFGGVAPEQRRQTILMTLPENQKAYGIYSRLYVRFIQYRTSVPNATEELEEVKDCSRELSEIRFIENDVVPVAVREFFNATSSGSGANLDLLTEEVIEWLHTNNMLNNYAVRAR